MEGLLADVCRRLASDVHALSGPPAGQAFPSIDFRPKTLDCGTVTWVTQLAAVYKRRFLERQGMGSKIAPL
jgi:hypothetical protein